MQEICDFHIHSIFSDGELLPSEIARRAYVLGNRIIAITDHVDDSNIEEVIKAINKASRFISEFYNDFIMIPGVELTHVPPESIPSLAKRAKSLGAKLIIVHGETIVEPVPPKTNSIACKCSDVDILAHPGIISEEDVLNARENDVFLEVSYRQGHCLGNGHVAKLAIKIGAKLLINSDAHNVGDFLSPKITLSIAKGAGLDDDKANEVIYKNPRKLLEKIEL
ncbi:MAG: histidinol phosphate phosphatase domain-containing protein [Candidatus Methanomethyliaceae archaeon]|nr:histidinol phosphate phosphatase domain-containing protein [Candidatus Methanomethyliaceae archaeon]